MAKTEHNRAALIKLVNLIKPALSATPYIPALTHICFDGKYATAYNDITAIRAKAPFDVKVCLPGLLFASVLSSFSGEDVMLQEIDGNTMLVSSGRSKLKMPLLPVSAFPLEMPNTADGVEIELSHDVIKGIERCLFSVGSDTGHPEQMGVTLDVEDDGSAVLYSTDNYTISRYLTKDKIKLPGGTPIILPTFFCHQVIAMSKTYGGAAWLTVLPSSLLMDFGNEDDNGIVFTKMVVDLEAMDFKRIFDRDVGDVAKLKKSMQSIPDTWDAALGRAMLVLNQEVVKTTKVTPEGSGKAKLSTSTQVGDAEDKINLNVDTDDAVLIDPALVMRGSKACTSVRITPKMTVLTNDDCSFTHLVAHMAGKTSKE